jgi:ClpA/ClpB-like protein
VTDLRPEDVVLVASRVLGRPVEETLAGADPDVIGRILDRAREATQHGSGDEALARAAGSLLADLLRLAPFGDSSGAVGFACVLQLMSVNHRDLELGRPEVVRERIERFRSGATSSDEIVRWLRGGIVRTNRPGKEPNVHQRRRRRESEAHLNETWDRFTDRARRSVGLAHEEAEALGDRAVTPEHLVLGMLRVPESVGARAMAALGITLDAVRGELGRTAEPAPGRGRMTPETKWVLQLAVKEAVQLDADHIGTEHMLLALTHLPVVCGATPGGSRLLPGLGLTMGRIRKEVFRLLTGGSAPVGDGLDRDAVLGQVNEVFAENERLRAEVERLRSILDARGIRPDGGDARSA